MKKYSFLLVVLYIAYGMWTGWVFGLDHFTLAIHEAGHPLTSLVSSRLTVYGGTIFQIMFPIIFCRHFMKQNNENGMFFSLSWLAASLHNVGIYMKDARAKELPLVGGLDPDDAHDWAEIFSRWNLLNWDIFIGKSVIFISWIIIGYVVYKIITKNVDIATT